MRDNRFDRMLPLVGKEAILKLCRCKVAVFGIGGVGSFTAEALVRGGIGTIDLFDNDKVDITNINRQLIALDSTVGKFKTEVMEDRIKDINPHVNVSSNVVFITPESAENIDFAKYDYVVDAVDNVTAKIAICRLSVQNNVPVISAMGAGNKLNPTMFEVAPIEKTSVCPLAKVMRTELKKRGIKGVKAVFSKEEPQKPTGGVNAPTEKRTPASISFVPSVAGLIIAGEVIKDLIERK